MILFVLLLILGQCLVVALNIALAFWGRQDAEEQSENTVAIIVISLAAALLLICGARSIEFFYMALRVSYSINNRK